MYICVLKHRTCEREKGKEEKRSGVLYIKLRNIDLFDQVEKYNLKFLNKA